MKQLRSGHSNELSGATRFYLKLFHAFGYLLFIAQALLVITLKGASFVQLILLGVVSTFGLLAAGIYRSIGPLAFHEFQRKQFRVYFRPYILSAALTFFLVLFFLLTYLLA